MKVLVKGKDSRWQDIMETKFGKEDPDALRNTLDSISSLEDYIQWASVLFECQAVSGDRLEEVKMEFDDPQHPGFILVRVDEGTVVFSGECRP